MRQILQAWERYEQALLAASLRTAARGLHLLHSPHEPRKAETAKGEGPDMKKPKKANANKC